MTKDGPQVVKAYTVGQPDSLVVVIPKAIREKTEVSEETHFQVQIQDDKLVYKPIKLSRG